MQGNEGQPSTEQQGIGTRRSFASRTRKTLRERERDFRDECCTKKPPPTYQNPRPVTKNKFIAPLRDFTYEKCGDE
jgi:hypothetical protein